MYTYPNKRECLYHMMFRIRNPRLLTKPLYANILSHRSIIIKPSIIFPYKKNFNSQFKRSIHINKNIPNILTVSRIFCAPIIGYSLINYSLATSFILFTYSCITDFLDGYLARKFNIQSPVGSILDPMADKLLMVSTTVALTTINIIPLPVTAVILGRDLLLITKSLYVRLITMKQNDINFNLLKFINFIKFPIIEIKPTKISKWNTFFQMCYLGLAIMTLILNKLKDYYDNTVQDVKKKNYYSLINLIQNTCSKLLEYGGWLVISTGIASGASYFNKSQITMNILKRR